MHQVSYRMLSRDLKVHNNVAKRMLFDFHHRQNSKAPGSVRANYIVDGRPRIEKEAAADGHPNGGDGSHVQSSPYMSSSMPQEEEEEPGIPIRSITLAREEDLDGGYHRRA